jgi:hypothetical protein
MPRRSCLVAAPCVFALLLGSVGLFATSSAVAKHKSSAAAKRHSSAAAKHRSKKHNSAAKEEPVTNPQPRTPVDTYDCITLAQAFYVRAEKLSKRAKQTIPKDFDHVVSKLDEFCGEEEFERARISIEWMSTCLQNFTTDNKTVLCSNSATYFCALDPQSDACLTREGRAD